MPRRVDGRLNEARKALTARREDELRRAEANHARSISAGEAHRDEQLRKINEVYATRITEVQTTQQRDLRDAIDAHDHLMAELKAQAAAKAVKLDEKYRTLKEQVRTRHESSWKAMADAWREGMRRRPGSSTRSIARPPDMACAGTTRSGRRGRCLARSRR